MRVFVIYICNNFHIPTSSVGYVSQQNRKVIVIKRKAKEGYFLCLLLFIFHSTELLPWRRCTFFRKSATTYHSRTYEQVAIVSCPSHQFAHHVITHCWTRKYGAGIFSKRLFIPSLLKIGHLFEIRDWRTHGQHYYPISLRFFSFRKAKKRVGIMKTVSANVGAHCQRCPAVTFFRTTV